MIKKGPGWGSLERTLGDKKNLYDRGVSILAAAPVDFGGRICQQELQKCLAVIDRASPDQPDAICVMQDDRQSNISCGSRTMRTRPSPNSVVPAMPRMPAKSPSIGFNMTSCCSPRRSTSIPAICPPADITTI